MKTFIFSHERGRFLKNLLASISEFSWPSDVTILDDCSRSRQTTKVLAWAEGQGYTVVSSARLHGRPTARRHGNLSSAMQLAFEMANCRAVLFLQDDMQFVRHVSDTEIARLENLVAEESPSPFCFPAFHLKSWTATKTDNALVLDDDLALPFRSPANHPLAGFSDVSIFSPNRLREASWVFEGHTEGSLSGKALGTWGPMLSWPDPFVAFLPFPRLPDRSFRQHLREPLRLVGPISLMTRSQTSSKTSANPPIAEELLRPKSWLFNSALGDKPWLG